MQRILRLKNLSPAATGRGAGGPASKTVVIAYGFWLFLLSDIVLFSCLFAAHAVLQTAIADGPAEHELFKPTNIAIETAYLPPIPAQAEQKIGVEGDRCLRLRFRLDQRIAHAVLERVARAVSRGRVFDVGMRPHHRAAGAQEPIGFAQIVLQLASGRCVSSELENPRSKGLSASGMR